MIAEYLNLSDFMLLFSSTRHLHDLFAPIRNKFAVQPKGNPSIPALLWAVWKNYEPLVRLLLSPSVSKCYAIDVNIWTVKVNSALHVAATVGCESIARLLLENGADVNARGDYERTPLIQAATNTTEGGNNVVRLLLQRGADVECVSRCGNSALDDAVLLVGPIKGLVRRDRIRILVDEGGADINAQDKNGCTLLSRVLSSGRHEDSALSLLEMGADPMIGDTLRLADKNYSKEVMVLLLKKLLELSEPMPELKRWWSQDSFHNGKLALHYAASLGDCRMVKYLLKMGIDPNTSNQGAETPLHRASRAGHEKAVRLLLDGGAAVDACDDTGWTPLYFAARSAFVEIVRLLLERGADVNALNECGVSALHWAAQNQSEQSACTVELMLEYRADVRASGDFVEETPLRWALEFGKNERVIAMLLSRMEEAGKRL